jgi:hypothetical protein
MSIALDRLDLISPIIDFSGGSFEYEGKKGSITLPFNFVEKDEIVGRGAKHMLVSGIKEHNQTEMNELVEKYNGRKSGNL